MTDLNQQSSISAEYLEDLCQRAFPHREEQQIRDVQYMGAWQHEMTTFSLDWLEGDDWLSEDLIMRRFKSELSWWNVDDKKKAKREVTVMRWLHEVGVPVPGVHVTENGPIGDVMLEQRLPGLIWFDLSPDFEMAITPYVEEYARLLALVHSQETPAAVQEVVPHITLMSVLETLHGWAKRANDGAILRVIDRVAREAMHVQELMPVTLHGDYHFANVLLHNNRITGIIDWEFSAFGDPRWDVVAAYQLLVEFEAANAASRFLDVYVSESGITFDGPPIWNVVIPLQAWALSAWLRAEVIDGRNFGFRMAEVLGDQYEDREARAMAALSYLG